jgi:hypothetical protein
VCAAVCANDCTDDTSMCLGTALYDRYRSKHAAAAAAATAASSCAVLSGVITVAALLALRAQMTQLVCLVCQCHQKMTCSQLLCVVWL